MQGTFKANRIYRLNPAWADHYSEQDEYNPDGHCYGYAKAIPGSTGTWMTDCWIVDKDGNRHPGYANSPVPVRRGSVIEKESHPSGFLTPDEYLTLKVFQQHWGQRWQEAIRSVALNQQTPPDGINAKILNQIWAQYRTIFDEFGMLP